MDASSIPMETSCTSANRLHADLRYAPRVNSLEQAERAGFDLSLAEESLRCTHEERALQHQEALTLALVEALGRVP